MKRKKLIKILALFFAVIFCMTCCHSGYVYATSPEETSVIGENSNDTIVFDSDMEESDESETMEDSLQETECVNETEAELESSEVEAGRNEFEELPDFSELPDFLGKGVYTGEHDPYMIMPMALGDRVQNWGMYQMFTGYVYITQFGPNAQYGYSHIVQNDDNYTRTAYCIEYGRECPAGGYLTEEVLSVNQKAEIGYALANGWKQTGTSYDEAQYQNTQARVEYTVTQGIIWACSQNKFGTAECDAAFESIIPKSHDPEYCRSYYNYLKNFILNVKTLPSFAASSEGASSTITLKWDSVDARYEATVTDSKSMLSYYSFTCSGINFEKNGNTLTIWTKNEYINPVTVTGTRTVYGGENAVVTLNAYNGKQDMATYTPSSETIKGYFKVKTEASLGNISLIKSSGDTSITSGNANYSLKGAVYGIYNSSGKEIGTITTDANGKGQLGSLTAGNYTVKEKTAPKGYKLDTNTYSITVKGGATVELKVKDLPITGSINIIKKSSDATLASENSAYSDLSAMFAVYNTSNVQVATIDTNSSGSGSVSGLPLGTYTVKEIKAPVGYLLNSEGQNATVSTAATTIKLTFTNDPILGMIEVYKASSNPEWTNNNSGYSLSGAVYKVMDASGKEIGRISTNASGYGKLENVPKGTYSIKEVTAPKGYKVDPKTHSVGVDYGNTGKVNLTDEPYYNMFEVALFKVNAESGLAENEKLGDAEFTVKLYGVQMDTDPALSGHKPLRSWVLKTDDNGQVLIKDSYKISGDDFYRSADGKQIVFPNGTLTIQETKAPAGYLLNDTIYVQQIYTDSSGAIKSYVAPTVRETPHRVKITLTKTVHAADIHFANGNPIFTFKVSGIDVKGDERTRYESVEFTKEYVDKHTDSKGVVSITVVFDDLIAGTYDACELLTARYSLEQITGVKNGTVSGEKVTFKLTTTDISEGTAVFINDNYEAQDYSDTQIVINELKR